MWTDKFPGADTPAAPTPQAVQHVSTTYERMIMGYHQIITISEQAISA